MKKYFAKILVAVLTLAMVISAVGCGGTNWKKEDVTLKDWKGVISNNGFIAETENYVYYINGSASSSGDNTFGVPVKGALMVASKESIVSGELKSCLVVPKLFVASDYNAGIFISGDYVYYATPSTDRDSSGKIANSELEFCRTKLDGTDTTKYFKTQAISDQYRIVQKDNTVYFVVYDSVNKKILSYNTESKTQTVVASVDETAETETFNSEIISFVDRENTDKAVVLFGNKVFTESYDKNATERATSHGNKIYAYSVGAEKPVLVLDGTSDQVEYGIKSVSNGEVIYTTCKEVGVVEDKTFAVKLADLLNNGKGEKVINESSLTETTLFVSSSEVYNIDTASGVVKKSSLISNAPDTVKTVAVINASSTLQSINEGYLYYINGNTKLARIELNNAEAKEQIISEDTVPTDWYKFQIIKGYAYYSDNSTAGGTYIKAVSLSEDNLKEKDEVFYFDNAISLAKVADSDKASFFNASVEKITSSLVDNQLVFDCDNDGKVILVDNKPTVSLITKSRKMYNELTDSQKKNVDQEKLALLEKYEEALKLSVAFYGLDGFDTLSTEQKNALKDTAYATAKTAYNALVASKYDTKTVRGYVVKNLNYYFQEAQIFFGDRT